MLQRHARRPVFIEVGIRPFTEADLASLVQVYQSAFAEPPWNEYRKCAACDIPYSIEDVANCADACNACGETLDLVEFWSALAVESDLQYALQQPNPLVLVAEYEKKLVGFSWGYELPKEKFCFLEGKISQRANYMDEIAVAAPARIRGVGTAIGNAYIDRVREQGLSEIVLRTDRRNTASMALFLRLGFGPVLEEFGTQVCDPTYADRVYLRRQGGEEK